MQAAGNYLVSLHAQRRRRSFGCHSADGCRFVERILTVVETLHMQRRDVVSYLRDAIAAHRAGQPAPKLLPAGTAG